MKVPLVALAALCVLACGDGHLDLGDDVHVSPTTPLDCSDVAISPAALYRASDGFAVDAFASDGTFLYVVATKTVRTGAGSNISETVARRIDRVALDRAATITLPTPLPQTPGGIVARPGAFCFAARRIFCFSPDGAPLAEMGAEYNVSSLVLDERGNLLWRETDVAGVTAHRATIAASSATPPREESFPVAALTSDFASDGASLFFARDLDSEGNTVIDALTLGPTPAPREVARAYAMHHVRTSGGFVYASTGAEDGSQKLLRAATSGGALTPVVTADSGKQIVDFHVDALGTYVVKSGVALRGTVERIDHDGQNPFVLFETNGGKGLVSTDACRVYASSEVERADGTGFDSVVLARAKIVRPSE